MENGVRSNGFRATREPSAAATSSGVVTTATLPASGVNQSQLQSLNNEFSGLATRSTSSSKQSYFNLIFYLRHLFYLAAFMLIRTRE